MTMKTLLLIFTLIFITNCSSHHVKFGKKCTKIASDNTYEKSFVWIVNKENLANFDEKINKENCASSGEKL